MDGQRIKSIRNSLKLTQKQLAKKVGISYQTISELENGKPIPEGKMALYEIAFNEILKIENGSDSVKEERTEYRKDEILDEILAEIKIIRKENEQLNNTVAQIKEENNSERKMNQLLRTQLQLAIKVLKDLDTELITKEKSTGTEKSIGKAK